MEGVLYILRILIQNILKNCSYKLGVFSCTSNKVLMLVKMFHRITKRNIVGKLLCDAYLRICISNRVFMANNENITFRNARCICFIDFFSYIR